MFPSRRAQPCQYEDVRREQDERLADLKGADLRGADLRGARGITNEDLDRQASSLEGATIPNGQLYEEEEAVKSAVKLVISYLRRILTCVFTRTGGAVACSFLTLASSRTAARKRALALSCQRR